MSNNLQKPMSKPQPTLTQSDINRININIAKAEVEQGGIRLTIENSKVIIDAALGLITQHNDAISKGYNLLTQDEINLAKKTILDMITPQKEEVIENKTE